jgi:hypothetical protein
MKQWAWILASGLAACGGSDESGLFGSGTGGSSSGGSAGALVGGSAGVTTGGGTGGSPDGGTAGTAATGGVPTGGSGGVAGAPSGGTGGGGGYTLDNVCAKYPQEVCGLRANCCQNSFGYDQAKCIATEKAQCDLLVAEVQNGDRTFDPSKIEPCFAAIEPLYKACFFTGDLEVPALEAGNLCGQIFPGTGAPGTPCQSALDCIPATTANGYYGCSEQSSQCYQGTILSQGTSCNYFLNVCDEGLDCATPSLSIQVGTCQPVVPTNGPCTSSNQCGLGNYCTSGLCQPAKETGTCSNFHHCLSLSCEGGFCEAPPPIPRQAQCGV